ncbi:UNVERIFIED_CONTAM: hypothetical protein K2H54_026207 [Gekko kuhli]
MLMNCRSAHIFAAGGLDESKSRSQDLVNCLPSQHEAKVFHLRQRKLRFLPAGLETCFSDEVKDFPGDSLDLLKSRSMNQHVINVRKNVVPRCRLQALPNPHHVGMANRQGGVKALRCLLESVLLAPESKSKLVPTRLVQPDRVKRIGQINHTVEAGSSGNGGHDLIVFHHNGSYRWRGSIQSSEIDSHSPSHPVSLQDRA